MAIKDALLPEFDQETRVTRTYLERVIEDKLDWSPHEKSMTLRQLATHIAEMPVWAVFTLTGDSFDVNPAGGSSYVSPIFGSRDETLRFFDTHVKKAHDSMASMNDEDFLKPWSLLNGGQVLFQMPKVAVIRSFILNHLIHHRGQLNVYLRLTGAAVPPTYGPSADEGKM